VCLMAEIRSPRRAGRSTMLNNAHTRRRLWLVHDALGRLLDALEQYRAHRSGYHRRAARYVETYARDVHRLNAKDMPDAGGEPNDERT
jgi:hypothetical protein